MANTVIKHSGGLLLCDSVQDAQVETTIELTEHAIDDGSNIADHAVRKPETIGLQLTQTQSPMRALPGFAMAGLQLEVRTVQYGKQRVRLDIPQRKLAPNVSSLISAGLDAVKKALPSSIEGLKVSPGPSKGFGITVLQADAPVDRVGVFYDTLLRLQLDVERVTLTFKGRDFSDYVITSVRKNDKPGRLGCSSFDVSLKKIRTVATKQVLLPAVPAAKKKKDRGVQYGPPLPPGFNEKKTRATIAAQIADLALGGGS